MQKPKHILITGASSGIGAALAAAYAEPGVRLSLHGRNGGNLSRVAVKAKEAGATVATQTGDVTDKLHLEGWILRMDDIQSIDLLIANAGISAGTPDGFESEEQSTRIFATNLSGVLNTIQPMLPRLTERRGGQLALMSSIASFRGMGGAPGYCASKAAVRIYGEALRADLSRSNIAVSVICPGFIKTPMTDINRFPMPLIMTAERAALIIQKGLRANKPRIVFPFLIYATLWFSLLLPQDWFNRLTARFPRKSVLSH